MLARLDQLSRLLRSLKRSAAELSDTGLEDFVNSRALETTNLMDQVRKAISEGRDEDARELLDQLAEQVQQMSESLSDQFARQQQEEDQLGEDLKKLQEELEQLAVDQDSLAGELESARTELGGGLQEQMDRWHELDELADSAVSAVEGALESAGHGQGWTPLSLRDLESLVPRVEAVREAITARDVDSAIIENISALSYSGRTRRRVASEPGRARSSGSGEPEGVQDVGAELEQLVADLDAIDEILQVVQLSSEKEPPALQELAQQMSSRQRELEQRQQQLAQDLKKVEQALPTADGSASRAMQKGKESMEEADRSLRRGESMTGEDHQRDAAKHIREAKDRLKQQAQQAAQMQRLSQQMQKGSKPQRGEEEQRHPPEDFTLPVPEDFQTPEEYRRALLEGMEADVPEEYRELNQRYFEELVRQ
jgi:phage shock protein A